MQIDGAPAEDRALVFGFRRVGSGKDVEEDCEDVAEEQPSGAERNHRLNRGESDPVTQGERGSKAQRAEDKGY